jgi:DNA-binding transcriptional MerR regulator
MDSNMTLNTQRLINAGFDDSDISIIMKAYEVTHMALSRTFEEFSKEMPEDLDMSLEQLREAFDVSVELNDKIQTYIKSEEIIELANEFANWLKNKDDK